MVSSFQSDDDFSNFPSFPELISSLLIFVYVPMCLLIFLKVGLWMFWTLRTCSAFSSRILPLQCGSPVGGAHSGCSLQDTKYLFSILLCFGLRLLSLCCSCPHITHNASNPNSSPQMTSVSLDPCCWGAYISVGKTPSSQPPLTSKVQLTLIVTSPSSFFVDENLTQDYWFFSTDLFFS